MLDVSAVSGAIGNFLWIFLGIVALLVFGLRDELPKKWIVVRIVGFALFSIFIIFGPGGILARICFLGGVVGFGILFKFIFNAIMEKKMQRHRDEERWKKDIEQKIDKLFKSER